MEHTEQKITSFKITAQELKAMLVTAGKVIPDGKFSAVAHGQEIVFRVYEDVTPA